MNALLPDDDDDELTLEDNANDELALESNNDNDDGEAVALEDNGQAGDDSSDDLALEDNDQADDDGGDLAQEHNNNEGLTLEENYNGPLDMLSDARLPAGQRVVVDGLLSKPELNGLHATVKSYCSASCRYGVKVDGRSGPLLSLRPLNLQKLAAPLRAKLDAEAREREAEARAPPPTESAAEVAERTVMHFSEEHLNALKLHSEARRSEEAASLLGELLPKCRRTLGAEHPETLAMANNLSALLQTMGKLAEAAPLCHEVVERRRAMLGPRDPSTLSALTNLGSLYLAQGKAAEAVEVRREVLEVRRALDGERAPASLAAMDLLVVALLELDGGDGGPQLEEALRTKTEELCAHIERFGEAKCPDELPAESKQTCAKAFDAVVKQPDVGQFVPGYGPFVRVVKVALGITGVY